MTANDTLTFTHAATGLAVSVSFDRWDALQSDRAHWCYQITDTTTGRVVCSGDDLTTVGDVRETVALESLGSFLSAYAEARDYETRTGRESENGGLFAFTDDTYADVAGDVADALCMTFGIGDDQ